MSFRSIVSEAQSQGSNLWHKILQSVSELRKTEKKTVEKESWQQTVKDSNGQVPCLSLMELFTLVLK